MSFYIRDCLKDDLFNSIDKTIIFEEDNEIYNKMRENIDNFMKNTIKHHNNSLILEIGPKDHNINSILNVNNNIIETVDIINNNYTTYVCDLTLPNNIPKNKYDIIYCLEVIEHCSNPKQLLYELYQLLKIGGILYLSFPFNFRIHGPLPDNWRISEYGIKELLSQLNFNILSIHALTKSNRPAFPISYTVTCKK
jgi:SAM-dependent methyltransferase